MGDLGIRIEEFRNLGIELGNLGIWELKNSIYSLVKWYFFSKLIVCKYHLIKGVTKHGPTIF